MLMKRVYLSPVLEITEDRLGDSILSVSDPVTNFPGADQSEQWQDGPFSWD